jgi:hypothetical protein
MNPCGRIATSWGMSLDLTDEEAAALAKHLRQAIDRDPYPLAPPDNLRK